MKSSLFDHQGGENSGGELHGSRIGADEPNFQLELTADAATNDDKSKALLYDCRCRAVSC